MSTLMDGVLTPALEWAATGQERKSAGAKGIAEHFRFSFDDPECLLGKGGYGEVFRGYFPRTNTPVAVKLFSAERAGHPFLREVRAWDRLREIGPHPTIPEIYNAGVTEDGLTAYVVMELLEGASLRDFYQEKDGRRLSIKQRLIVLAWVLEGLNFLGSHGLVHRDIKPENIFVQSLPKTPKIIDFGTLWWLGRGHGHREMSRRSDDGVETAVCSSQTRCEGTVYYLAPEAIRKKAEPASDVFSLGVVLLEMLGGVLLGPNSDLEVERRNAQNGVGFLMPRLEQHFGLQIIPLVEHLINGLLEAEAAYRWGAEKALGSLRAVVNQMPDCE